jgi:hypothetical protein
MIRSLVLSLALVFGAAAPAVLTGCATTQTMTFERSAEEVIAGTNEVVTLTRTLLRMQKITSSDAENVLKTAETARDAVAVARGLRNSNPEAAKSRLRTAADAMDGMAAYLATRSK